ncbi:MAG: DUF3488 domain-containing protein [Planctomycetaceae bacterium]|nr:DUF3488 domain-containing protein [Planctomycetaceae bacterium]
MLLVFQVSLAVMMALSGVINSAAEELTPLGAINAPLALLAFFFVDRQQIFRLPGWAAAILGLTAFVAAGVEFRSGSVMAPLLAGNHLIIYLGWVFLLQQKEVRHYSWLMALSVLQIATASVLTGEIWFGPAFVFYAIVGSWTLAVFLVNRLVHPEGLSATATSPAVPSAQPRLLVGESWRGLSRDVDRSFINSRFVGSLLGLDGLAFGLSILFFIFIPRIWLSSYSFSDRAPVPGQPTTGFTDRVQLGDLGEIAESHKEVMEVELFHLADGQRFSAAEYQAYLGVEPRFRGSVLEAYDNGNWERISGYDFAEPIRRPTREPTIEQRIQLEPLNVPILPAFGNVLALGNRSTMHHLFTDELFRSRRTGWEDQYDYTLFTNEESPDAEFHRRRERMLQNFEVSRYFRYYQDRLLRIPDDLERLEALAESVTSGVDTPLEKAKRLENWFLSSGEFGYSLNLAVMDPTIDPVEDFLFNRKQGHCEYFASSMALMLRAVGIPSRLITGFKGGIYSSSTGSFSVQELHAHAWVEAMVDGRWYTLDPTPAARADAVANIQASRSTLEVWKERFNRGWQMSTRLSKEDQEALIYRPLGDGLKSTWTSIQELMHGNTQSLRSLWSLLQNPRRWVSWQGGIVSFVLLSLLSLVVWGLRRLWKSWKVWRITAKSRQNERKRVAFYERFLRIVGKRGLRQQPTQTAREFVRFSVSQLRGLSSQENGLPLSDEFAEMFYRIRFGGSDLTDVEASEIERRLDALEEFLSPKPESTS